MIATPVKANRKLSRFGVFLVCLLSILPLFHWRRKWKNYIIKRSSLISAEMKNFSVSIHDDFWFAIIVVYLSMWSVCAFLTRFFFRNQNVSRNITFYFAFSFSHERLLFSGSLIMRGSRKYWYFPTSGA